MTVPGNTPSRRSSRLAGRAEDESGWVLIAVIAVLAFTLIGGLALASAVGTQTRQTRVQRSTDAAQNVAQSALVAASTALATRWPTAGVSTNTCTATQSSGSLDAPTPTSQAAVADVVEARLKQAFPTTDSSGAVNDYAPQGTDAAASWTVQVCDNRAGETTWNTAIPTRAGTSYDGGSDGVTGGDGLLWVRATATVRGQSRSVAQLVRRTNRAVLPRGFATVSGGLAVTADIGSAVTGLTPAFLNALTTGLLGTDSTVIRGTSGLRCGLLNVLDTTKPCVSALVGTAGQLTDQVTQFTGGLTGFLQSTTRISQYGPANLLDDATITALRSQAAISGIVTGNPVNGASCFPSASTNAQITGKVVYVDAVASGAGTCTIDTSKFSGGAGTIVIVRSGKVVITGGKTFRGVVYDLNRQFASDLAVPNPAVAEIVTVTSGSTVQGGLYVDGGGEIGIYPPKFDISKLTCTLLGQTLCAAANPILSGLGLSAAINNLINGGCLLSLPVVGCTISLPSTPVTQIVQGLLNQNGPSVVYDDGIVGSIVGAVGSGPVAGSFRNVPPS